LVPILVFDIETIPDIQGIRSLYALDKNLSDDDVVTMQPYIKEDRKMALIFCNIIFKRL